ncbi:MAG: tagaturonate reductase [Chthoniobacteraceae bacterium]
MSKLPSLTRSLLKSGFNLPKNVAVGPLATRPEKVLQFGEGNFLRAFVDWMIDEANERAGFNGSVVAVQPIAQGLAGKINEQDGLYTLIARGVEAGKVVENRRIISSISRALNPYDQWASLVELVRSADLRFVISNTTEAGIAYVEEPHTPGVCPNSFPAKVANLLYERFQAVQGDAAKGLVFIPCELIERNGAKLKEYVLKHAAAWNLGAEFTAWIESANAFLNTLVDRIVPGYPRAEAEALVNELGYQDNLIDTGEVFHLWVIEGPAKYAEEFPLAKAGLNVIWTDDQTPYRTRKVRVLNGAHTSSVLASYLGGLDTVGEMMDDPVFGKFIRRAVFDEIVPALPMEEAAKKAFAEAVVERFQNPFIRHELLSISLNSVSKWKVRVLPSLLDTVKNTGKLPAALAFSLAALISFYKGTATPEGAFQGLRNGAAYPIRDDADILEFFKTRWASLASEPAALAKETLSQTAFWGQDLNAIPGLTEAVASGLAAIQTKGARAAVEALLA